MIQTCIRTYLSVPPMGKCLLPADLAAVYMLGLHGHGLRLIHMSSASGIDDESRAPAADLLPTFDCQVQAMLCSKRMKT